LVVIIDVIDSKTMYIPDHLLVMVLGYILLYTNHISTITIFERIIGTLLCSIPMLLMNILIMETFGGGDVKLVMLFGYFLGYAIVLVMVIAIMAGGIYSFWLLYIKRIEQKYIPFAPFLCKSILLVIFWGKDIIAWYFRI
jgi:prepilin signal peptidase PulO-like enzyme (type II secretory pathway)